MGVYERRQREIWSQYPGNPGQQLEKYVDFFMDHDPVACWRRIIVSLDGSGDKEAAGKIRHLAEDVTGESRLPGTVCVNCYFKSLIMV